MKFLIYGAGPECLRTAVSGYSGVYSIPRVAHERNNSVSLVEGAGTKAGTKAEGIEGEGRQVSGIPFKLQDLPAGPERSTSRGFAQKPQKHMALQANLYSKQNSPQSWIN